MFRRFAQSIVLLAAVGAIAPSAASCATGSQGSQKFTPNGDDASTDAPAEAAEDTGTGGMMPDSSVDTGGPVDSGQDAGCDGPSCSCSGSQMSCPGLGCIDVSSDLKNCGACGTVCTSPDAGGAKPLCFNGKCVFSCPADAGPNVQACPGVGCVDVTKSIENCGGCGTVCGTGQTCTNGVCCGGTSKLCGGSCIDITSDPNNCGDCAKKCATGGSCSGGKCVGYTTSTPTPPTMGPDACAAAGPDGGGPDGGGMGSSDLLLSAVGWEASAVVTLPMPFSFYGAPQTQFWIGSQGTMGFGPPPSSSFGYPFCPLPDSFNSYGAIEPFGDSLDTTMAGVCYAVTGTAPNRQLTVTWNATHESDPGSILKFSVVFTETTNTIDFVYVTATPGTGGGGYVRGSSATVGLQSPDGKSATQFACGTGSNDLYNATPFAVHFDPL